MDWFLFIVCCRVCVTVYRLLVIVEQYYLVAMNFDCQIILDEFLVIDDISRSQF